MTRLATVISLWLYTGMGGEAVAVLGFLSAVEIFR